MISAHEARELTYITTRLKSTEERVRIMKEIEEKIRSATFDQETYIIYEVAAEHREYFTYYLTEVGYNIQAISFYENGELMYRFLVDWGLDG